MHAECVCRWLHLTCVGVRGVFQLSMDLDAAE